MNGILLVDKPQNWTSHDVVAKLRGVCGEKRIGHSGTLDPMATGLLTVFLGRATKAVEFSEAEEKEYLAHLRLGMETDTQDVTGTVLRTSENVPDRSALEAVLPLYRGEIDQIPPMYSAIKISGQKLYEIARRGGEVARQPRRITIHSLDVVCEEQGDFVLRVRCSKGTYIRTLCHDIGQTLGCGGTMSALRRMRVGAYRVEDAQTMETLCALDREAIEAMLLPTDSLFARFEKEILSPTDEAHCRNGRPFSLDLPDGSYRFYGEDNVFLMLGEIRQGDVLPIKRFF